MGIILTLNNNFNAEWLSLISLPELKLQYKVYNSSRTISDNSPLEPNR